MTADAAEELPHPDADIATTGDFQIPSELKEITDGSVTDDEPQ